MSKKFLAGFITGAVAGTITGILFASEKGSDIRHKAAAKMGDCFYKLKQSLGLNGSAGNQADDSNEWEQAERPFTANNM